MSRVHQINGVIDSIGEVECKLDYAQTLVYDLIEDYGCTDLKEMRTKISWELPRVQAFLNIIFDYCYAAKAKSAEIMLELDKICDEIKTEEGFPKPMDIKDAA